MENLTPWYPPEIKPVRVGVYHASRWKKPRIFRYWDGETWSLRASSVDRAMKMKDDKALMNIEGLFAKTMYVPGIYWRGLARKP